MCLIMLFFSSIYFFFLFHPLLIGLLDLILFIYIIFLRILIVYHFRFLVPQIHLPMFDQFILIILQVLISYSSTHVKLHSHLQSFKLRLRLWIHFYVNPHIFVSPQNYHILLILIILYYLFPFQLLFIVSLSFFSYKETILNPI